ncbi:Predicted DNA-binding transcriptional regulator YafY, contains an HTH and WYL domains [Amycolatopsis australiensis]|uniref:Predicted DNA-binding transcriptional regulator YafY, contains an HTH and WYL domains n=1 Tax=Amycolatopsis australiensis TaxID=546364 RepID=A0A1K1RLT0_9PSEU|nr:Predicted DNA-binding transcriptional regulator YafY, contains an HTH and WYL domains [Amycolatopsis australiensis]
MRADRLVSLVLLLRQRGRLTADALARELEVSPRTVLRDIDALSAAGVPVYAERGRHGGFALLPGFRTELTGLNHDEALALLTAGPARVSGPGPALASATRKVVDALPEHHRATASDAARRFLVEPETDLLSRRPVAEDVPRATMLAVRHAVLTGHRLRIHYAAAGQEPRWRTVDPIGLVTVRERTYLLATRSGTDRTYRLSRVLAVEGLPEPAAGGGRPRPDLAAALRAVPGGRPAHRGSPGAPGAAGRAAEHRGGRPRGAAGRERVAADGGDLPGRLARRVGAVAAGHEGGGTGTGVVAHRVAGSCRRDRRPLRGFP